MVTAVPVVAGFDDLTLIGRGGYSVVYSANQTDLGRKVAIKVLNLDVAEESLRRRFQRECSVLGALSGVRGIVGVHQSAFTDDGRPCIVMEYMSQGSLEGYVARSGPLSAPAAADWMPVMMAVAADPVRNGSSEKHSKFLPASGFRCKFTVGANTMSTDFDLASSPRATPTCSMSSRFQVAPSAVPQGVQAEVVPTHRSPRTPTGPSLTLSPGIPSLSIP